jgi:hypothetical protein
MKSNQLKLVVLTLNMEINQNIAGILTASLTTAAKMILILLPAPIHPA